MALLADDFVVGVDTVLTSHTSDQPVATWPAVADNANAIVREATDDVDLGVPGFCVGSHATTPGSADYYVELQGKNGGTAATDRFGAGIRMTTAAFQATGSDAYYTMTRGDNSSHELVKSVNAVITTLDTDTTALTAGTYYTVRITAIGTAIEATLDSAPWLSATDAAVSAAGWPGFYLRGSGRVRELVADDIGAGPAISVSLGEAVIGGSVF